MAYYFVPGVVGALDPVARWQTESGAVAAFLNAPSNAVFYFWAGRDFSIVRARREWPTDFLRTEYLPVLVTNWVVCVPVLFAIYALPTPLQVQISGVTSAFWVLVCLGIGARRASCESSSRGV